MGTAKGLIFAALLLGVELHAAPPTTQATSQDISAAASTLVAMGHAAMRAGDANAALESYLDARTLPLRSSR